MNPHLYLIDVSNYLFRSFYALPVMSNPKGQAVQAVFGLARALIHIKMEFQPSHALAIFDGRRGKQKRQAIYSEYKANRIKAPQELLDQIPLAQELCQTMGLGVVFLDEYEADDLIAAAVHQAQRQQVPCTICSSDKDLLQLVGDSVWQLQTHKNNLRIDASAVYELFGVKPSQIADWLALCGDSSDNIPGVAGIGAKTAAQLLEKYESLEGIISHLGELSAKRQEGFDISIARLSYELAKLRDVEAWQLDLKKAMWTIPERDHWLGWFEQMGFRSLVKLLEKIAPKAPASSLEPSFTPKAEPIALSQPAKSAQENPLQEAFCAQLDLFDQASSKGSTASKKPSSGDLRLASHEQLLTFLEEKKGVEILIDSLETARGELWLFSSREQALYLFSQELFSETKRLQEALKKPFLWTYSVQSTERQWLRRGLEGNFQWVEDLHLAAFLHFADGREVDYGMLCNHFHVMGFTKWQELEEALKMNKEGSQALEVALYNRLQAIWALKEPISSLLQGSLKELYQKVELPLATVLARMEHTGVCVDVSVLEELSHHLRERLGALERLIFELCETSFNLNSPKQLAQVLYEKLGLPILKQLKTGPSTNAKTLEELEAHHPVIREILHYRELEKLRSTYVEALPSYIDSKTRLIHPHFEQTSTATGRLSCHEPNLQNIPVRTQEGLKIRRAFCVREPSYSMVSADYSQIELRLMAHLSEDPELVQAFHQGEDIHRFTASLVFEIPLKEVSDEQRALAKAVNFGIIYGQQAFGLSRQLAIPMAKASAFIHAYFLRYPGVAAYMRLCKKQALEEGYVCTLLGRKRYIPEMKSSKATIRQLGDRLSVNTPVQGGGADLIKLAMLRIEPKLKEYGALMLLQIHDELIFECPDAKLEAFKKMVKQQMEEVYPLRVPLVVNIAVGKNWMEC